MPRKRQEIPIESVVYSYVGSDTDFNKFLKSVVHDYLNVVDVGTIKGVCHVDNVEKTALQ